MARNGKLVASASGDETVKLWDAGTGEVVETVRGNPLIHTIQFDTAAPFLRTNFGYIKFNLLLHRL
ncbi:hypothetical protein QBC37DRAFT_174677 [Rhypophila decipiens]|uniref:Uncharacterized protein n=1 Tax=Rhypophila decipiens TaxID=261697 RepID=A0AAN7B0L2_9PEZI|nr:hypothetical protein QBC37DRAFT_174677 [Rhypophila decipiens]